MIIHHHRSLEIRERSSTGRMGSQQDGIIEVITPEYFPSFKEVFTKHPTTEYIK